MIKGTRISVEHVVELLANGCTEAEIFESYPHLKREHLLAVFDFMRDSLKELAFYDVHPAASQCVSLQTRTGHEQVLHCSLSMDIV